MTPLLSGVWLCFLLQETATVRILINLMKVQAGSLLVFSVVTLVLIAGSLIIIQQVTARWGSGGGMLQLYA